MKFEEVEVNSEKWLSLENLLNEEWRDIKGYEGLYQVSNYGRVKSSGGKSNHKEAMILKQILGTDGYFQLTLRTKIKQKKQSKSIHRLVAENFIPNINNFPQINHIDEKRTNNRIDNLEWCSYKYNNNYGNHRKKLSDSLVKFKGKEIIQCDLNNNFIKKWKSLQEAKNSVNAKSNVHIWECCNYKRKTAYGYIWRYADGYNS